jgi:hypothetical protein
LCPYNELPPTVTAFLNSVYSKFKRPEPVPSIDPPEEPTVAAANTVAVDAVPIAQVDQGNNA